LLILLATHRGVAYSSEEFFDLLLFFLAIIGSAKLLSLIKADSACREPLIGN